MIYSQQRMREPRSETYKTVGSFLLRKTQKEDTQMNFRNAEHYYDPTAGQAIRNFGKEEERMKLQRRWGGQFLRR